MPLNKSERIRFEINAEHSSNPDDKQMIELDDEVILLRDTLMDTTYKVCRHCDNHGYPERDADGNWIHRTAPALRNTIDGKWLCMAGDIWEALEPPAT